MHLFIKERIKNYCIQLHEELIQDQMGNFLIRFVKVWKKLKDFTIIVDNHFHHLSRYYMLNMSTKMIPDLALHSFKLEVFASQRQPLQDSVMEAI